jgi:6-phosphogluconolactonase
MKRLILPLLLFGTGIASAQKMKEPFLIVGTYTSGESKGIYVYRFNTKTGDALPVSMINSSNPSYLAISPDKKYVYSVNEDNPGMVTSYAFDAISGTLTEINKRSAGGKHPCYITIDKTGRWVIVGNYSSGTIAVLPVQKNGMLDSAVQVIEHTGYSVNEDRQQGPHVHATVFSPDNKFLFVPDLGIDKVMIYGFDAKKGLLSEADASFEMTEAGAGPRHFEFHPNGRFAYLIEELTGSVSAYQYEKGQLTLLQNISALPGDYSGPIGSADIHVSPDGKFLYASNRGESNSIAIFSIDKSGRLQPAGHASTLGKTPRNFNFDPTGNFLLVANQNSNEIVIFKRDLRSGLLSDTGKRIPVGKPVCIKWVK